MRKRNCHHTFNIWWLRRNNLSSAPVLTFQNILTPFSVISSLNYVQSAPGGNNLPVLQGQTSNPILFRIYNNFALAAGIATAINIYLTVYDGVGVGSHTCAFLPVSQSWIHAQEYGYGENSVTSPDGLTTYLGTDTAIGGSGPCGSNQYAPEKGSDGSANAQIRAYSSGNGQGFIEFQTKAVLPTTGVLNTSYNFSISLYYEWIA